MCLPHGKEHEQAPSLFPSTLPLLHFSFTPSVAYALAVGDVQAFGREGGRDSRGRGQRQEVILSYLGNLNSGLKRVMVEKHQSEKNLWIVQIAAWQTALGRLHLDRQQEAAFGQRYAKLCIILSKTELRERKRERRSLSGAQQTGALFTHFLTRKLFASVYCRFQNGSASLTQTKKLLFTGYGAFNCGQHKRDSKVSFPYFYVKTVMGRVIMC